MRKWLLTPVFALALAGLALGQVQATSGTDDDLDPRPGTREIRLSGEIDFSLAFQNRTIAEVMDPALGIWPNSVNAAAIWAGTTEDRTFAYGKVVLRTVAVVSDNVRGNIEIWTAPRGGGFLNTFGQLASPLEPIALRSAYIDLTEVIDPSIRLRLGLQDVETRLRGDREGPFWLDLRNSTSPWYGINMRQPVGYRTVNNPVGAWLNWQYDSLVLDIWAMPVVTQLGSLGTVVGGQSAGENEQLYMLQFTYKLPSIGSRTGHHAWRAQYEHTSRIIAHISHLAGGVAPFVTPITARNTGILNLGLGVDLVDIGGSGLELFAEGIANLGSAGRTTGVADTFAGDPFPRRNLRARGLAFQVGGRYDYHGETFNWWLQVKFNHYSGDNNASDRNWAGFIGYGNQGDFLVIEDKDVGLGLNTNLQALKFQGGFDLQIVQAPRRLMLDLGLGFFRSHQALPTRGTVAIAGQRRSNRLGTELDAKLTYVLNESVQFRGAVGYLIRPEALRRFTPDATPAAAPFLGNRRDAWIATLGFDYRY